MILFIVITGRESINPHQISLSLPEKKKKTVGPRVLFWTSGLLFLYVLIINMFEKEPDYFF